MLRKILTVVPTVAYWLAFLGSMLAACVMSTSFADMVEGLTR
jgi:hypothetical protein